MKVEMKENLAMLFVIVEADEDGLRGSLCYS